MKKRKKKRCQKRGKKRCVFCGEGAHLSRLWRCSEALDLVEARVVAALARWAPHCVRVLSGPDTRSARVAHHNVRRPDRHFHHLKQFPLPDAQQVLEAIHPRLAGVRGRFWGLACEDVLHEALEHI